MAEKGAKAERKAKFLKGSPVGEDQVLMLSVWSTKDGKGEVVTARLLRLHAEKEGAERWEQIAKVAAYRGQKGEWKGLK